MAYVCNECRRVSAKKFSNCPGCGFSFMEDDRPVEEFVRLGYRELGKKHSAPAQPASQNPPAVANETPAFRIDDSDYLNQLRNSFRSSASTPNSRPTPVEDPPQPPRTPPTSTRNVPPNPVPPTPDQYNTGDTPFFDLNTPPVEPVPEPAPIPPVEEFYLEPEVRHHTGTGRRPGGFRRFWRGLWNFIFMVPWRAVFILLTVIAIIVIAVVIWNMRHQIVSALLAFLIELIPLGLLIGGIIYLIRRVFR